MRVQNIKRSSIWKIRLSTATMTLIPAAVGINNPPGSLNPCGNFSCFRNLIDAGIIVFALSGLWYWYDDRDRQAKGLRRDIAEGDKVL